MISDQIVFVPCDPVKRISPSYLYVLFVFSFYLQLLCNSRFSLRRTEFFLNLFSMCTSSGGLEGVTVVYSGSTREKHEAGGGGINGWSQTWARGVWWINASYASSLSGVNGSMANTVAYGEEGRWFDSQRGHWFLHTPPYPPRASLAGQ